MFAWGEAEGEEDEEDDENEAAPVRSRARRIKGDWRMNGPRTQNLGILAEFAANLVPLALSAGLGALWDTG